MSVPAGGGRKNATRTGAKSTGGLRPEGNKYAEAKASPLMQGRDAEGLG
jgi:hypothetical protein